MKRINPVAPLRIEDRVIVADGGVNISGVVKAISPWVFILVETESGHLYLDVVFNVSAVSWSRIILLEPWVEADDVDRLEELARQIGCYPKRTDVNDVDGALKLCDHTSKFCRVPSEF
jgi:hypothetical protein